MSDLVTVSVETLPLIAWLNQPVITTEILASLYEVQEKQIWQNFNNNKDRFAEGKHYFKLTGSELKDFKNCIENFEAVRIAPRTPNLMLWTERGTVRHAKMLGTDKAWDVQEKLEEFYFSQIQGKAKPPRLPGPSKTISTHVALTRALIKLAGVKPGIATAAMLENIQREIGMDTESYRRLIPGTTETVESLNATNLGKSVGMTAREANQALADMGLQQKNERGEWELTEKGKAHGAAYPFARNGHASHQILWLPTTARLLGH